MITKSAQSFTNSESTAAASIIQGIGPQKYERKRSSGLSAFSTSSL